MENKKNSKPLSDNDLQNVSGGGVSCSDYDNTSKEICESMGCKWYDSKYGKYCASSPY